MRINTRVCYTLRLMADISKFGQGHPVPLKESAERQNLSRLYLSQLTIPLKNASLLKSVWGNKGGYLLARPASEIRMLDIVHAVCGPIALVGCLMDTALCNQIDNCRCAGIWRDINEGIIQALSKYTLQDLIDDSELICGCNACQGVMNSEDVAKGVGGSASTAELAASADE